MINVDSEVGKGTTFQIYLPIVDKSGNVTETEPEYSVEGGTETILIAEDDEAVRELATRILEDAGYRVLVAVDGSEAVTLFEQNSEEISLVILDMVMPKMGGLKAIERIEKIAPDVRALFCSGYSSKAFMGRLALQENVSKIQKPYSRNTLMHEVRKLLDA